MLSKEQASSALTDAIVKVPLDDRATASPLSLPHETAIGDVMTAFAAALRKNTRIELPEFSV